MKTVIPYVGSRYKKVYEQVSEKIGNSKVYIEPFGGGFSLGLNLIENRQVNKVVYNDLDKGLYDFWICVRESPFDLIECIDELFMECKHVYYKEEILEIIQNAPRGTREQSGAAKFIRQKFNSLGSKVNTGNTISKRSFDYTENIIKASELMQDVVILNKSYSELAEYDSGETFWSCDPPFDCAIARMAYERCKGKDFEHEKFLEFMSRLSGKVFISYNYSDKIIKLANGIYSIEDNFVDTNMSTKQVHEIILSRNMGG